MPLCPWRQWLPLPASRPAAHILDIGEVFLILGGQKLIVRHSPNARMPALLLHVELIIQLIRETFDIRPALIRSCGRIKLPH